MERANLPKLSPLTTLPSSPFPSSSYLYPTHSIPTTPSLLSRPSSLTRLRPIRSSPQIAPPATSTPSLSKPNAPSPHKSRRHIHPSNTTEDDWITRTASTLTLSRLEEKGVSWLAARESSTSLTGIEADDEYDPDSPVWTRSQMASRGGSRSTLQQSRSRRGSSGVRGAKEGVGEREELVIGPDFVDVMEEDEEDEVVEEVDEGEMRRVVMGRVGGWVDWAVGWMDFRAEGEGEGEEVDEEGYDQKTGGDLDVAEVRRRLQRREGRRDDGSRAEEVERVKVEPPPGAKEVGALDDAKWLLSMATKIAL